MVVILKPDKKFPHEFRVYTYDPVKEPEKGFRKTNWKVWPLEHGEGFGLMVWNDKSLEPVAKLVYNLFSDIWHALGFSDEAAPYDEAESLGKVPRMLERLITLGEDVLMSGPIYK